MYFYKFLDLRFSMRKFEKNKNLLIIFNLTSNSIFQCKKILYEFPIFQIERNTIESNKQLKIP